MIIEIFKTNVQQSEEAKMLTAKIKKINNGYTANFDLEDCDKILRVKSTDGPVTPFIIISLLNAFGFKAEILDDNINANSITKIFRYSEQLRQQRKYLTYLHSSELHKVLSCEINEN